MSPPLRDRRTSVTAGWPAHTIPNMISLAAGTIVILGAVFASVKAADRVQASVEALTIAVGELKRTTAELALATTSETNAIADMQSHLRVLDAAGAERTARIDLIESYLVSRGVAIHDPARHPPATP